MEQSEKRCLSIHIRHLTLPAFSIYQPENSLLPIFLSESQRREIKELGSIEGWRGEESMEGDGAGEESMEKTRSWWESTKEKRGGKEKRREEKMEKE